jgi:hypothetical protein
MTAGRRKLITNFHDSCFDKKKLVQLVKEHRSTILVQDLTKNTIK